MTSTGALHPDSFPFPVREYQREQADLVFLYGASESEMGVQSNFGAMVDAAMGAQTSSAHHDYGNALLTRDPRASYRHWSRMSNYHAAERARKTEAGLARMIAYPGNPLPPATARTILRLVYGPDRRSYPAWGMLGGIAPFTTAAIEAHARAQALPAGKTRLRLGEWLNRLSTRIVGEIDPANENHRKRATPTEAEVELTAAIRGEAEARTRWALQLYARARVR